MSGRPGLWLGLDNRGRIVSAGVDRDEESKVWAGYGAFTVVWVPRDTDVHLGGYLPGEVTRYSTRQTPSVTGVQP